ncbi:MAG: tetratricopeptide repeat protein [Treponema sp.]|nr:tetratricopeptide repeat protein [Treponema sp.]
MKKFYLLFAFFLSILFFSCSKPGDLTVGRAMKAYQAQNYEEALRLFNEALSEESNYSKDLLYNFITSLYLQQDDYENAVIYQEKLCEERPDYRNFVSLGMTWHLLKQDEKAVKAYERAVELNPKKGEAYASLGALFLGKKDYEKAADNLKKAAEFEPKIAVIHANLGVALAKLGENEKSEEEFKIAEELKCENLEEFRALAAD